MGRATDEAGNIWETDAQGNAIRMLKPAASAKGAILADPYAANDEERKQQDQANEAIRLELARQAAARADAAEARAGSAEARAAAEFAAKRNPDGSLKVKVNPDREAQIKALLGSISRLRQLANKSGAVGGVSEIVSGIPILSQNRRNVEGALQQVEGDLIQQQIAILSAANGGNGVAGVANSEQEARRMAASIANLDPNQDLAEFLRGVDEAENYYLRQAAAVTGQPLDQALVNNYLGKDDREYAAARLGLTGGGQGAAGSGASEQSVPIPPDMQAEMQAWFADNPDLDPGKYAAYRQGLDAKYGFGSAPTEELQSWAETARTNRAKGAPVPQQIPPGNTQLEGFDYIRNQVASHPAGTFAGGVLNAGGFGLPQLLAGDQYDAMRDLNPGSAVGGEIVGGIAGTMLGGGILNQVSRARGLNPTTSRILANPLTADVGYGATYGATTADDPLYGAVTGAGGAFLGNKVGGAVAQRLPGMVGIKPVGDTLNRGERAVVDALTGTGVEEAAQALQSGYDLGVPLSLADVSYPINALTGSAMRNNRQAADPVIDALMQRSAGQHGRLESALERDLGPVTNIPERTDALFTQARTNAGPLYDAAYGAPGVEDLDIANILARPSVRESLPGAMKLVQEADRNPFEMGFVLNDAGVVEIPGLGRYVEARGPMPSSAQSTISGAGNSAPDDLVTFVRRNGGLSDFGGELKFMDVNNRARRGVGMAGSDSKAGRLIDNDRGLDFDEMAERAWEAGYFGPPGSTPRPTVREFLDAFENNYRGDARTFSIHDQGKVADYNLAADARQAWEAAGPEDLLDTSITAGPRDFAPPEAMGGMAPVMPTWETLDFVKRALDQRIADNTDALTGRMNSAANSTNQTRLDLLRAMDTANPDYAAARAAWAGPVDEASRLREAQGFLNMPTDELAFKVKGYTPPQMDVARLGIQSDLANRVAGVADTRNPFEAVLARPRMQENLSTFYPEDNVARLLAQRDLEREVAGSTNRLIGNSMTQDRAAADAAYRQTSAGSDVTAMLAETAISGAPIVSGTRALGGRMFRNSQQAKADRLAGEMAGEVLPITANMDSAATISMLEDMAARDSQYQVLLELMRGQAGARGGHALGGAGAVTGGTAMR